MARTLYNTHNEFPVYPGHPVTLALEIMLVYKDDIEAALAPAFDSEGKPLNYCVAVSNCDVSGGGGSVRDACDLLRKLRDGETIENVFTWGFDTWADRTLRGGDHRNKYEEGEAQAQRLVGHLREHLLTWVKANR